LPTLPPQIIALGGGGFSLERGGTLLDDYVLQQLASPRPRVCFLPTASGDADHYIVRFYRRFAADCEASHVSLFRRDQGAGAVEEDLERHLLTRDLIYVGGGNMLSMIGAWRAHGLDRTLRRAWRAGIVLCGPSAGSLCWFAQALSAFHGSPRAVAGLGLLPYSNCVHYDAEPARRAEYHRAVELGMCAGYAADDGVALHFRGRALHRVLSARPGAAAYRVALEHDGVREHALEVEHLGEAQPPPQAGTEALAQESARRVPAPASAHAQRAGRERARRAGTKRAVAVISE
jgi:dipeptidase E